MPTRFKRLKLWRDELCRASFSVALRHIYVQGISDPFCHSLIPYIFLESQRVALFCNLVHTFSIDNTNHAPGICFSGLYHVMPDNPVW